MRNLKVLMKRSQQLMKSFPSYDYLQRKQELEKLRAAHEDLQKENESLRDQTKWLKCLTSISSWIF